MCQKPIIMMKNVVDVTFLREKPNGKDENIRGERNLQKQLRYLPSKNDIGICFSFPMRDGAIFFRAWRKKKALQQLQWVLYTPLLDGTKWSRAQLAAAAVWLSPSPTRMKRIPYSQFPASQKREIARKRERVSCSPCCNLIVCHKLCVCAAKGTW